VRGDCLHFERTTQPDAVRAEALLPRPVADWTWADTHWSCYLWMHHCIINLHKGCQGSGRVPRTSVSAKFQPLPNATLQPCELETQIYNAHTFPYQNGVSVQFLYSLTAKASSVSSSANPFCNTMHEYAACPIQDRHLTPARPNQGSNDRQPHHGLTEGSEDAHNRSSLDLSRGYRNDNLASSTSSLAQAESLDTPGQSLPSEAFPPPTRRLGRNFSGGYSRWKTSWRLQTVIIGFFLLGICIPDPQPINH
jgi:hypothetical protein